MLIRPGQEITVKIHGPEEKPPEGEDVFICINGVSAASHVTYVHAWFVGMYSDGGGWTLVGGDYLLSAFDVVFWADKPAESLLELTEDGDTKAQLLRLRAYADKLKASQPES